MPYGLHISKYWAHLMLIKEKVLGLEKSRTIIRLDILSDKRGEHCCVFLGTFSQVLM